MIWISIAISFPVSYIPAHDGGLALVSEPAPRSDLRELLELDPITFLERRGCQHVSLRLLVSSSTRSNPALTGPPQRQLRNMREVGRS